MSPELIKGGNDGHDFSVDWWSIGVLTYELLTGASPFTVDGERNTQSEISKRILRCQPPIPEYLSQEAGEFITLLLIKEPEFRLGGGQANADQLKQHPFLADLDWNLLKRKQLKAPFKPKIKHELDVSNFADEFTSMAPHVLVASSNNQLSSSEANSQASIQDEDQDDDEYESADSETESDLNCPDISSQREPIVDSCQMRVDSTQVTNFNLTHHRSILNNNNNNSDNSANNSLKQFHNGVHYSKLFPGYSYINPDAIEWLNRQEVTALARLRESLERKYSVHCPSKVDLAANQATYSSPAARAEFMDDLQLYDDIDLISNNLDIVRDQIGPSRPVNFTIGDGEDLASAVRQACSMNCPVERLVVARRKPSLELLYERHANNQVLVPKGSPEKSSESTKHKQNQYKSNISYQEQVYSNIQLTPKQTKPGTHPTSTYVTKPKLGSILFDPSCEFFKFYHLVNPLNSKCDLLGEGAYSICKKCIHKETGKEYAVKLMSRSMDSGREIETLRRCQGHSNIVKLYDVFQDRYNSYLVFELLKGGELLNRIRASESKRQIYMNEAQVSRLFRSLISTVDYLHSLRIVHRDLKPENLLFVDSSPDSELKLIDFGFARELPEPKWGDAGGQELMSSPCITLDYCAPEVLNQALKQATTSVTATRNETNSTTMAPLATAIETICTSTIDQSDNETKLGSPREQKDTGEALESQNGYDESCDLWSMGVILYAMLSGHLPFTVKDSLLAGMAEMEKHAGKPLAVINRDQVERARNPVSIDFSGPRWAAISQAPKDIIRGLLTEDPSKRLTLSCLLQNDWVKNFGLNRDGTCATNYRLASKRRLKNERVPITMTLRKRVAPANQKLVDRFADLTHAGKKGYKLKRPIETQEPAITCGLSTVTCQSSGHARGLDMRSASKRPKLAASSLGNELYVEPSITEERTRRSAGDTQKYVADSKWIDRFVQIGRTSNDNLRITFKALNKHHSAGSISSSTSTSSSSSSSSSNSASR